MGIALAPETLGAGVIVAGIGVVAIVGGAITWGVYQHMINEDFEEIGEDQAKIRADKRQIVALQGLSLSVGSAIDSIELATSALSDVRTMWQTFQNELQGTKDKLESANEDLSAIVNKAEVLAAQEEWKQAVDFSQQLMGIKPKVESKTLSMAS